jgi:AraC-like DNA-binding protein
MGEHADDLTAIQYLVDHYPEPITIDDLACHCGYSPAYLATKFRQCFGLPPTTYLLQLRLQRGCTLLHTTDRSVASIALAVGFRDSRYFATRFGQAMGMTPSAYRFHNGAGANTGGIPAHRNAEE